MRGHTPRTLAERFSEKFDRHPDGCPCCPLETGCWVWTAARNEHGYGVMRPEGRRMGPTVKASRVSLILDGRDPGPLLALHTCDNPGCVNPAHLYPGTRANNNADMVARGRSNAGERNPQAKLTEVLVGEIRRLKAAGVSEGTVSDVLRGKTWRSAT